MLLRNQTRNAFFKCDTPKNTINRICQSLHRAGIEWEWTARCQISDDLFWCQLQSQSPGITTNGKGCTAQSAETSALAEMVERLTYPAVWTRQAALWDVFVNRGRRSHYEWVDGYLRRGHDDLGEDAVSVEELVQRQRLSLNGRAIAAVQQCEEAGHWVNGYSLIEDRMRKVPIGVVDWISGSNGLAAGNTLEEAIVQGTCELFERHCAILSMIDDLGAPTIDPSSIPHPAILRILQALDAHGVDVTLKDWPAFLTTAVLFCNRALPADHLERDTVFFGASLHPEEAILRALTESVQGRGLAPDGRVFMPRREFHKPQTSSAASLASLLQFGVVDKSLSSLRGGAFVPMRTATYPDVRSEIEALKLACKAAGSDWIVINLTNPVIDFPVVRVVIPGLLTTFSASSQSWLDTSTRVSETFFGTVAT